MKPSLHKIMNMIWGSLHLLLLFLLLFSGMFYWPIPDSMSLRQSRDVWVVSISISIFQTISNSSAHFLFFLLVWLHYIYFIYFLLIHVYWPKYACKDLDSLKQNNNFDADIECIQDKMGILKSGIKQVSTHGIMIVLNISFLQPIITFHKVQQLVQVLG